MKILSLLNILLLIVPSIALCQVPPPQTGQKRAEEMADALQNPDPFAKESGKAFKERLLDNTGNPYQGGVDDSDKEQRYDARDLLDEDPLVAGKIPRKRMLQQCVNPQVIGKNCCVIPFLGGLVRKRDLYGYRYPMLLAEVTENSYITRLQTIKQVQSGCDKIYDERRRNGADWLKKRLKKFPDANGGDVKQSDINEFSDALEKITMARCINELAPNSPSSMAAHVVPAKILLSKEYQEKLAKQLGLEEDTFNKMSAVARNLATAKPIGTDNWEGFEFSMEVSPEKTVELENPRHRPNTTDPAAAYRKYNDKLEELVKNIMARELKRPGVTDFDKFTGTMPEDWPNFPGKGFSIIPMGKAFNHLPWNLAWQIMVLAATHKVHSPNSRTYPLFEVEPYSTIKGAPMFSDSVFVQGGPFQDPKCYGGTLLNKKDSFRFAEQYGGTKAEIELHDVKVPEKSEAYNMKRYVAFIYAQTCPIPWVIDYTKAECITAAPHMDFPAITYEYYGSGGKFIPPFG